MSLNLKRRHLSESQRGIVAGKIANMRQGRQDPNTSIDVFMSQLQAAELLNVGEATVQRATKVLKDGVPELIEAVEAKERQREAIRRGNKTRHTDDSPVSQKIDQAIPEEKPNEKRKDLTHPCVRLSQLQAAEMMNVGRRSVARAHKVRESGVPEFFETQH